MNPGDGSPLHIHTKEDEIYYVLSGEVEVIIDDERQILRSGDCVFLPRYVPHQLQNPGQKPAQVLLMIHPPGLEYFFEEMARLRSQGEPSREAVSKLIARYF
jgi:mannose-6-phosphate isomerase-like protein (cupin superfamily)